MKWRKWSDKMAFVGQFVLWLNIGVFLMLGVLATLLGGTWTQLGNGLGGGEGIPAFIFTIPILLGIPSLMVGVQGAVKKDSRKAICLIFFFVPLFISVAFILIPHSIDPCTRELWTLNDRWGTQKLCERFGSEISIHTRFHLLLHVAPTCLLLAGYHFWFRRIYRMAQTEQGVGALM